MPSFCQKMGDLKMESFTVRGSINFPQMTKKTSLVAWAPSFAESGHLPDVPLRAARGAPARGPHRPALATCFFSKLPIENPSAFAPAVLGWSLVGHVNPGGRREPLVDWEGGVNSLCRIPTDSSV